MYLSGNVSLEKFSLNLHFTKMRKVCNLYVQLETTMFIAELIPTQMVL
jgi:hypothetical protein